MRQKLWILGIVFILVLLIIFTISNFQPTPTGKGIIGDFFKRLFRVTPTPAPDPCNVDPEIGLCTDNTGTYAPACLEGEIARNWKCVNDTCVKDEEVCSEIEPVESVCDKSVKIPYMCQYRWVIGAGEIVKGRVYCDDGCIEKDNLCHAEDECHESVCLRDEIGNNVYRHVCVTALNDESRGYCTTLNVFDILCEENERCDEDWSPYKDGVKRIAWCEPEDTICEDTDAGEIYDKKGTCTEHDGHSPPKTDYCIDTGELREYYCHYEIGECWVDDYACFKEGKICRDGACVPEAEPTPTPTA